MKKYLVLSLYALASVGCSTVQMTRVQPGHGGELAVQEGLFGEPANIKAERVMQDQCPQGYEVESDGQVVVGSVTTTQTESQGKVKHDKLVTSSTTVSETRDKTERRIIWKCKGAALQPIPENTSSGLRTTSPTGWTVDFGLGRRWYKPQDTAVSSFHSTAIDIRGLYEVLPGFEIGGDMHVDGYDNDTSAENENFTSSLFEFGLTTKLSHRFGNVKPYVLANYYFYGQGNREYERSVGFVTEKYTGRNISRGVDGALGLALILGEGSVFFEWYRSAEREMMVKGRLEQQTVYPSGAVFTSSVGDKRSFRARYDGFAVGLSFPIKN